MNKRQRKKQRRKRLVKLLTNLSRGLSLLNWPSMMRGLHNLYIPGPLNNDEPVTIEDYRPGQIRHFSTMGLPSMSARWTVEQ